MIRYQIIFTGTVQNVGFRYHSMLFAKEHHCTGWVKNLEDGRVLMEVQGTQQQIDSLIHDLKSIKHITITSTYFKQLPLVDEESFTLSF